MSAQTMTDQKMIWRKKNEKLNSTEPFFVVNHRETVDIAIDMRATNLLLACQLNGDGLEGIRIVSHEDFSNRRQTEEPAR